MIRFKSRQLLDWDGMIGRMCKNVRRAIPSMPYALSLYQCCMWEGYRAISLLSVFSEDCGLTNGGQNIPSDVRKTV